MARIVLFKLLPLGRFSRKIGGTPIEGDGGIAPPSDAVKECTELIELLKEISTLENLRKVAILYFHNQEWHIKEMTQGIVDLDKAGLSLDVIKAYVAQLAKLENYGVSPQHIEAYTNIFVNFQKKNLVFNSVEELTNEAIELSVHEISIFQDIWRRLGLY